MKISQKIVQKLLLIFIILGLIFAIVCLSLGVYFSYSDFLNFRGLAEKEYIDDMYIRQPKQAPHSYGPLSYNCDEDGNINYSDYYRMWQTYFTNIYKYSYHNYKICLTWDIVCIVILSILLPVAFIYIKKIQKRIKKMKLYRNYMLATNKFKIEDISKEFGENIETVERSIQEAIDKKILKNVYLSKQTKEILLINKIQNKANVNKGIQNINITKE